jgi:hypothetical protein
LQTSKKLLILTPPQKKKQQKKTEKITETKLTIKLNINKTKTKNE